jgi:hypothetical protein
MKTPYKQEYMAKNDACPARKMAYTLALRVLYEMTEP